MMVFLEAFDRVIERAPHETALHGNNPKPRTEPVVQNRVWRNLRARRLCSGCTRFVCVRWWRSIGCVLQGEDAVTWMRSHGLFENAACYFHGADYLQDVPGKPDMMVCQHRLPNERKLCRARVSKFSPILFTRISLGRRRKPFVYWEDLPEPWSATEGGAENYSSAWQRSPASGGDFELKIFPDAG